jgi:hypothetical protein
MEPLARYGFKTTAIGCWQGSRLVGGALFRSYGIPFTRTAVTECLDGPIFLEWDGAWADDFVARLIDLGKTVNATAMIIKDCPNPLVHHDLLEAFRRRRLALVLTRGPADAILPLQGRSMDQIRSGFNHGTRQRVKKGQAGALSIRRVNTETDLAQAYAAWIATANRKSFNDVRPWEGLQPVLRHSIEHNLGTVLGSFLGERLLAAAFVVHVGTTAAWVYGGYMDGAEKHNPTHVLQFEAIRESLERGMERYNFGNLIAEGQPTGRGVDEFKLGFGAQPERHLDTIVWKRRPLLYDAIERIRRGSIGGKIEALLRKQLISRGAA